MNAKDIAAESAWLDSLTDEEVSRLDYYRDEHGKVQRPAGEWRDCPSGGSVYHLYPKEV